MRKPKKASVITAFTSADMSLRMTAKSISSVLRQPKVCRCGKVTRALSGLCRKCFLKRSGERRKRIEKIKPKKNGRIMHENATMDDLKDAYKDLL